LKANKKKEGRGNTDEQGQMRHSKGIEADRVYVAHEGRKKGKWDGPRPTYGKRRQMDKSSSQSKKKG